MAELSCDVPALIAALRRERIAVPVLACGVDAPATRAVAAVRAGAIDYLPLPPSRELIAAALLAIGHRPAPLVGAHPAWREAVERGERFAQARMPLLILGAAGTGKQALARHLHAASALGGPLVLFDPVAADPEALASELFGHRAGAFDGAIADRPGKLGEAEAGTLLVRHVDRLPLTLQQQLAPACAPGPARIIAMASCASALHPALAERFRLGALTLPSLAERGTDLLLLARHFAEQAASDEQLPPPRFTADALAALQAHFWPGNVAELEQVVHRALLLAGRRVIEAAHILPEEAAAPTDLSVTSLVGRSIEEVERALILGTLSRCGGNRTSASAILGISVRTMRNKLRALRAEGLSVAPAA
jgi:DNA-binding NtrC family response regulator